MVVRLNPCRGAVGIGQGGTEGKHGGRHSGGLFQVPSLPNVEKDVKQVSIPPLRKLNILRLDKVVAHTAVIVGRVAVREFHVDLSATPGSVAAGGGADHAGNREVAIVLAARLNVEVDGNATAGTLPRRDGSDADNFVQG